MSDSDPIRRGAWPELILSGRPFLGMSSLPKEQALDALVRFADPANSAGVVSAAARHGLGAIAPMNDATLLRALDLARTQCSVQVYPVIPNAIGYVRDATDHGMVGAGLKHLRRLSLRDLVGIGLRGLTNVRRVMMRDFKTVLSLLIDVEMAAFKRFRPRLVLLHSQVTDIALALGNSDALRVFAEVVRGRFGAEPGVVTNNFGMLMPALAERRIDIPVVVAPFNAAGFLMKPSKPICETLLRQTDRYVIADRLGVGGVDSLRTDFDYLGGLGIRSAIVDVADAEHAHAVMAQRAGTSAPAASGAEPG